MPRTYIDDVVLRVENRTHIRDRSLVRYYALLVLTKGEKITLEDVHDAWAMNMNFKPQSPNCYGHEHRSIKPFEKLDVDVREKDRKFLVALLTVAKELKLRR